MNRRWTLRGTNTVVATIPVGVSPTRIALSPRDAFAYVTNFDSFSLSVIDTTTNTVSGTIDLNLKPSAIAITPDDRFAYLGTFGSFSVSIIRTMTNSVIASVAVGIDPSAVAMVQGSPFTYVTNFRSDTVSVIARDTSNDVIATIPVEHGPFAVAIGRGGFCGAATPTGTAPPVPGSPTPTPTPVPGLCGDICDEQHSCMALCPGLALSQGFCGYHTATGCGCVTECPTPPPTPTGTMAPCPCACPPLPGSVTTSCLPSGACVCCVDAGCVYGRRVGMCVGDCNGDGRVTIDELLTGVGIILHTVPAWACLALCNRGCGPGGAILPPTVDCLVHAANNALHGCAVGCTTDQDCDDGNPCSLDICAPSGCVHECLCL